MPRTAEDIHRDLLEEAEDDRRDRAYGFTEFVHGLNKLPQQQRVRSGLFGARGIDY